MIVTYLYILALIITSLLIQGHSSFDVLRIVGIKPDLTFIIVIYLAYNFGPFYGVVTGFICGILHDAVSNSPLGLLTLPKVALGLIVGMFGRSILRKNILSISMMILFSTIAKGLITLLLCYLFTTGSLSTVWHIILPESLYNAILAPFLFYLFDKIFREDLSKEEY
ncbi:MAG: rod shape-determining protein MreD [Spirochaetota bacterium]|nr:rod shape-determining protein MreD [Spirochaetota bacterium]